MKSKLVNSSLSICLIMSIAAPAAVVDVAFAQITPVQSQITSLPEGTAPERFAASNENAQQMTDTRNALLEVQARSPQDILQGADISYPGMDVYLNADGTISRVDYLDMASGFLTAQDFYYSHTGRWTQVGNRLNDGSVQKKVMYTASQMRFREYFFNSDATLESVLFFDEVTGVNFSEELYNSGAFVKARNFFDPSGIRTRQQIFADNSEILYQTLSYNPVTGAVEQRQTYDVQGRVVQISDYDQEGLESRQRNYDALGRQTSDQRFLYATVAAVSWKQIDDYDEIGNLVQTSSFQNGRKAYDETFNPATGLSRFKRWYYQTTTAEQLWRVILCDGQGKASQLTEYDRSGALVHSQIDVSYLDTTVQTQAGMAALQDASPSGLLPDNPDDNSFVYHEGNRQDWAKIYAYTQASTYEQAVIGIDFLKSGQNQRAKTLLDFFYAELHKETDAGQAFTGFYTLYNIDPVNWWKKYEWRKTLGETAWVALFALHYAEAVADPVEKSRALELATAVGKWAALVPHLGGAVAMGMPDSQYGWVISVENNLDYYVICRELAQRAASAQDRALFATEAANNKNWLKASAYDPVRGLFRGGGIADYGSGTVVWRNENPLDSNSWAIGAIGPQVLQDEFGINLDEFVGKIGASFAVSDNGTFGGSLGEAKGFDFGDGANAATLNRRGLKWFEGTQQMILAYKILARFHRATTPGKATYYENLARLFSMRNSDNALAVGAQIFYPYADVEGAQIFGYTNLWKTPYGWRDPNSNAWADLSELGINPFFIN